MGDVRKAWNEFLDSMRADDRTPNEKNQLTDEDYVGFDAALDARAAQQLKPKNIEEVRTAIRRINPIKYRQVMSDYRWLQKQMQRLGLNPEDARYLF